jgi:flagellar hook-associated protein 3 FlgL
MRVSNDTLRTVFLNALEDAQRRIVDTQTQVSTGRRINTPSDDPVAAARIAELDASLSRLDQYQANSGTARNQLGLEEEALASTIDNLQRVRELTVQANNATLSVGDRKVIAQELHERAEALRSLGNTTDANGRYLFAGYSEATQPFTVSAAGAVVYNGDQGQRTLQVGQTRFVAISDSGSEIFQKIPTGNGTFTLAAGVANTGTAVLGAGTVTNAAAWVRDTYTISFLTPTTYEVRDGAAALVASGTYTGPKQSIQFRGIDVPLDGDPAAADTFTVAPSAKRDVFATIDALATSLETNAAVGTGRTRLHNEVGQLLQDVDQATGHAIQARAEIGSRVRALDEETSLSEGFRVQLGETISDIRDLDYAEALTRLSQQLFGLQAAQQAYSRTQGLSLFRYL